MDSVEIPCIVCGEPVEVVVGFDEDALCLVHFFVEDPTAEWEADE